MAAAGVRQTLINITEVDECWWVCYMQYAWPINVCLRRLKQQEVKYTHNLKAIVYPLFVANFVPKLCQSL